MSSCYLHVDLDAFFASVEQLDNPEYKGKAVIVGGLPSDRRAVVSTCSYEARKYGVHSAMPTAKAYQLCPNGIYLRGRMERYHEKSREVMKIFYDFSPDVKQMSVDEAFIDITGTEMLFGPPEEVAKKLKKEVLEKTGLTVSIGIAYNKYIAKIASGINKPNGLCFVPEGKESDFMLSLPLSKLWGAGTKTQQKLKSFGFYTMKDIYNAPFENLTSLFGNCTGSFLYNAVRGQEVESFSDIVKSHSISTEETFSYDLTDIFTIETALLKLCYEVRFRLLDEGFHTKTLHVKIRYEDFTTVSVQSTAKRHFSSLDDMYEKVCELFKSKYEYGKGIRLLGVGALNLEKGTYPQELELFDFGEEKKQKIEEAVLSLQKKNPKSEIKKARQFIKKGFLVFLMTLALSFPQFTYGEKNQDLSKIEKETEFFAEGEWEATLKQNIDLHFQNNKPYIQIHPLVFTQKAALSVFFMYDKKWYFDAVFQDGFENNKISAGYENQFANNIFTEIKVGNKDIYLTEKYGEENLGKNISSGKSSFFGTKFLVEKKLDENKKYKTEGFFSFNNLENFSKTWYGKYSVSSEKIELNNYIANKYFNIPFLPFENFSKIEIYLQKDQNSPIYSKLDNSQFLVLQGKNQIEFKNQLTQKTALVIENKSEIENLLVDYIKNLKSWFNEISLKDFLSYLEIDREITDIENLSPKDIQHFFTKIENKDCLYIYIPGIFSLFENKNIFPFKISNIDDVSLISKSANVSFSKNDISFSMNLDGNLVLSYNFWNNNETSENQNIKEIKYLFPLGNTNPLIYLYPNSVSESDIAISINNYSMENNYNIGTNADENSVICYINDILTPVEYDKSTGEIKFSTFINEKDKIQVFWKEYSKEANFPVFMSTAGFLYFTPDLKIKTSLGFETPIIQNNMNNENFSLAQNPQQQNFDATFTMDYQKNFEKSKINIKNTAGFEYVNYDITKGYLIFSAYNPNINKQEYFQYDSIIKGNGKVSKIENQKYEIVAELAENANYSELNFYLPKNSIELYEAEGFYLNAQFSNREITNFYNVFLEIGDIESNFEKAKWNINQLIENNSQNQKIYFPLSNIQKSKLGKADKAKIIFEKKNPNLQNLVSGNFTIKSMEYVKSGFIADSGIDIQEVFFEGKVAEKIVVKSFENENDLNMKKNLKKYVSPLPVTNYKDFSISVFIPESQNGKITVSLNQLLENGNYSNYISKSFDFSSIQKNTWTELNISLENVQNFSDSNIINPTEIQITVENENSSSNNEILFYLEKMTLKNGKIQSSFSDVFDFSYNFKDFFAIETKIFSNFLPTKSNKQFFGNIINNIHFYFPNFKFENTIVGSFDFNKNNNDFVYLKESSHNFATEKQLFNFLGFNENFVYNFAESSVSKINNLTFDFSKSLNFLPMIFKNDIKVESKPGNKENSLEEIKYGNQYLIKLNYEKYNFVGDFNFTSKSQNTKNQFFDENYFSAYYNSLLYQTLGDDYFSTEDFSNLERKETLSISQDFALKSLNIKPQFLIHGENLFAKNSLNPIIQSFEYNIALPFYVKKNNFNLSYGEKVLSNPNTKFSNENIEHNLQLPKNFTEDLALYFENKALFALALPFTDISGFEDELTNQSEYNKIQNFNISWNRNIFANYLDFFIPVGFSLNLTKDKKIANSNFIENYNFLGKLTFSAFNIFGKNSDLELFDWYKQEEIVSTLSMNYVNENWIFGFSAQSNFYLSDANIITDFFEVKYAQNQFFSILEKTSWNRTGKTCYLIPLIKIFEEDFEPKKITRFNSFDFSLEKNLQNELFTFAMGLEHKVGLFLTDFFSIDTEISLNFRQTSQNQNTSSVLSFVLGVSGKLIF